MFLFDTAAYFVFRHYIVYTRNRCCITQQNENIGKKREFGWLQEKPDIYAVKLTRIYGHKFFSHKLPAFMLFDLGCIYCTIDILCLIVKLNNAT